MRRVRWTAWGLLAALSSPAQSLVFVGHDRIYVSTAPGSLYSPIGMVSWMGSRGEVRASGTLIGQCYVITARHIAYDEDNPVGKRMRFTGAVETRRPLSSFGTVVAAGGLSERETPGQQALDRRRDWLLLRLDQCLGVVLGHAELAHGGFMMHGYQSAGYPIDRNRHKGLSLDPSCSLTGFYADDVWGVSCAALPGNSGGPVFRVREIAGRPRLELFAISVAGYASKDAIPYRPDLANIAVPYLVFEPVIRPFLSRPTAPGGQVVVATEGQRSSSASAWSAQNQP